YEELHSVRNFHQAFHQGMWLAMANAGLQLITKGRYWGIKDRVDNKPGYAQMRKLEDLYGTSDVKPKQIPIDGKITFDKLTDVYYSSTKHSEDQPCHLRVLDTNVCVDRCTKEYGNPCQYFCPAKVYEMVDDGQKKRLQINFSNCVHCKTCDIMDPYQVIDWVTPE